MALSLFSIKGGTPLERFLRSLGLVLVFLLVAWAFTKNNERVLEELNSRSALRDETGGLSGEDMEFLKEFALLLRTRFGQECQVKVFKDGIEMPKLDSRTLFVGLSPARGEVTIVLPELMRAPLGPDFDRTLEREFLKPAFARGDWQRGLRDALTEVWARLTQPQTSPAEPRTEGPPQ